MATQRVNLRHARGTDDKEPLLTHDAMEIEEISHNLANAHLVKETSKRMTRAAKRAGAETFFYISKRPRVFLDAKEVERLFLPHPMTRSSFARICISNRSISVESERNVEPILVSVKEPLLTLDSMEIEETSYTLANKHLNAKETRKPITRAATRALGLEIEEEAEADTVFDISKGPRDFLDAKEAKQLFRPLAKKRNSFTKICFSNRSFRVESARIVGPILASVRHQLTHVDLSDCVAGVPEDEALEVMKILSMALEGSILKSLDLSSNALGEKGVRAFGSLLRSQSNLEELYLKNDGISPQAAIAVSELLPSTDKLKILHFDNNMTGDEGAFAIADILKRSPLLEDFRCSSTRVDAEGSLKLVEGLKTCKKLRKVDLRDNMFGVEAGITLSKILGKFRGLTEIYLSYLNLEDDGTNAICNALRKSAPSLTVLDIAGNEITRESVPALVACIQSKRLLTKLNLSENELEDEGAVLLGKALEEGHTDLEELDVSTNSITSVGATALAKAVVSSKPRFSLLNLNGNAISDEGVDEVKYILKVGKKSDVLGPLDENDVNGEELVEEDEEEEEEE